MKSSRRLVVATRSADKLREIREIARGENGWEIVGLEEAGIRAAPEEEGIEIYDTFHENARAKALYFAARTPELVLADDSGLCVAALDGEPGVRSRRFAPPGAEGEDRDTTNNRYLLGRLAGVPAEERQAHYHCTLSLARGSEEMGAWTGRCEGVILDEARGGGGFGYDPLFYLPSEGATFGELDAQAKNRISHRARAVRQALAFLAGWH